MKINRLHMAVLAAMLGSAALVGCKKKEEPAPPPSAETAPAPAPAPAPMPTTASVNSVDLGNAVGAVQHPHPAQRRARAGGVVVHGLA